MRTSLGDDADRQAVLSSFVETLDADDLDVWRGLLDGDR